MGRDSVILPEGRKNRQMVVNALQKSGYSARLDKAGNVVDPSGQKVADRELSEALPKLRKSKSI